MIYPIRAESLITVMDAKAVSNGVPFFSDMISLAAPAASDAIGYPCMACELWIHADTDGTTDALLVEIFPCEDGDTALRASEASDSRTLLTHVIDPYRVAWHVDWTVGFGHFQVKASLIGTTDTITTTIKARRYRLADGRA